MTAGGPPGLTGAEVEDRRARGLGNDLPPTNTRTFGQILRANLITRFNLLLGGLLIVILVVGPIQDALFGGVLVANALIGIIQEVRAKQTLDRLSILSAPRARVRRDGEEFEVPVTEVVLDDVLELTPGDQVVVDAEVVEASGLEVDESLLTGESDPVLKQRRRRGPLGQLRRRRRGLRTGHTGRARGLRGEAGRGRPSLHAGHQRAAQRHRRHHPHHQLRHGPHRRAPAGQSAPGPRRLARKRPPEPSPAWWPWSPRDSFC